MNCIRKIPKSYLRLKNTKKKSFLNTLLKNKIFEIMFWNRNVLDTEFIDILAYRVIIVIVEECKQ